MHRWPCASRIAPRHAFLRSRYYSTRRRKYTHKPHSEIATRLSTARQRSSPRLCRPSHSDISRKLRCIYALNLGIKRPGSSNSIEFDHAKQQESLHHIRYVGSAVKESSFLPDDTPEVAVIGRSNVGKSSFINALSGGLAARTSPKPGETRTLNWYSYGKGGLRVVDLPGYGFSFAKDPLKERWTRTVSQYFCTRSHLKRVFVLVDARHGLKVSDRNMLKLLNNANRTHQVVLTKGDLIEATQLAHTWVSVEQELSRYKHAVPEAAAISSKRRLGFAPLHAVLLNLASPP